jgi:preprotein translocase subunit SecG
MINILISFLTFVLILVSLFLVLVILMQRANSNAGLGSAFGGGMAESTFGAETTNILVRMTKWSAALFFLLSLSLYLLYMAKTAPEAGYEEDLPDIPVHSAPAGMMDGNVAPEPEPES